MWGKIIIPMYRLWLNGLYGLYGPRCPLSSKRPINLISLSLSCVIGSTGSVGEQNHHCYRKWLWVSAIILCMYLANERRERRRYNVTSSLIGWVHPHKAPQSFHQPSHAIIKSNTDLQPKKFYFNIIVFKKPTCFIFNVIMTKCCYYPPL